MSKYEIGRTYPLDFGRDIIGPRLAVPVWHALIVPPMKERAAAEMLKQKGVHAFFPERERKYHRRGKSFVRKFPEITQIVYAKFRHAPNWDVLRQRRLITGVFSRGDTPINIPSDVIRAVQGLPTVAEELAAARAEMLRVRGGDKATITAGPLSGFMVDVSRVEQGRAWFETMTGIKGEMDTAKLERCLNESRE